MVGGGISEENAARRVVIELGRLLPWIFNYDWAAKDTKQLRAWLLSGPCKIGRALDCSVRESILEIHSMNKCPRPILWR